MIAATETITPVLSAQDLKALRQADMVSFHHYKGVPSIVATKRVKNAGPFDERERKYEFTCSASFSGRIDDEPITSQSVHCFAMLCTTSFHEVWQTVLAFLRPGDEIVLDWHADGEKNGYIENSIIKDGAGAGMKPHADALYLKIKRGEKRFAFLFDVSYCPDNTARMIRSATL